MNNSIRVFRKLHQISNHYSALSKTSGWISNMLKWIQPDRVDIKHRSTDFDVYAKKKLTPSSSNSNEYWIHKAIYSNSYLPFKWCTTYTYQKFTVGFLLDEMKLAKLVSHSNSYEWNTRIMYLYECLLKLVCNESFTSFTRYKHSHSYLHCCITFILVM